MKLRPNRFLITHVIAAACLSSATYAATATKSATGTDLTGATTGVWTGGSGSNGSPTSADIATWTSSSLGAALTASSSVIWGSINISGALTDIDITGNGSISTGNITLTGNRTLSIANNIVLSGSSTYSIADVTASTADDATLSGVISGAFALSKTGAGTLALTGSNSYTGATTISAGVLSVNSLANGGSNSGIGASGNAAGNLVFAGGTLKYTGGSVSTNRAFKVTANSGIEVTESTSTLTFNSAAASEGVYTTGLTKTGAGTLVLGGASNNAYLQLWVNAGTVELAKSSGAVGNAVAGINAIADGATVKLTGASGDQIYGGDLASFGVNGLAGTLDLSGHSEGTSHFNGVATGKITNSTASTTATWTIGQANVTSSFAGTIENGVGTIALTKAGTGTQTLSGTNSYTGATTLSGGALSVGLLANGGSNSGIGAASTAAANLVLNGGTLKYTGASVSTDRAFTLNAASGIEVTSAGSTLTFNSSATGAYTITLTKTGAGTLALGGSSANSYMHLVVSTGTVELAKSVGNAVAEIRSIAAGATVKLTGTGGNQIYGGDLAAFGVNGLAGTLDLSGHSESTSNFNGVSTGKITNSTASTTATWTVGESNVTGSSFAGVIENGAGTVALAKIGSGTQTLSGTNTYTGITTLSGGVLSVALLANGGSNSAIGASTNAAANLVFAGGTLKYTGGTMSTDRAFKVTANSGIEVTESTSTLTFNSAVASEGVYTTGLTKTGAGTLVLGGASNNAWLQLWVNAGTVELAKSVGTVGNAVAGINAIAAGATVKLTGASGDQIYGAADLASYGVNSLAGTLDLSGHSESTSNFNGVSTGKITNSTASTTATWTVGESNVTSSSFAGVIEDGSGIVALTKIGTGTQTLSGTNTYTGATTLSDGVLSVSQSANLGGATSNLVFNGGTLQITNTTISSFSSRPVTFNTTKTVSLDIAAANNTFTVDKILDQGTGGLKKLGAGTVILNQANTYSGATTVNGGTLLVNNTSGSGTGTGTVTIKSNATLGGSGSITGAVTLEAGATHAVGAGAAAVGKQSFGDLSYAGNSIFEWGLASSPAESGRGTNYDAVNVTGALTGSSNAIFRVVLSGSQTFSDAFWNINRTWSDIFKTADDGSNLSITSVFSNANIQYWNQSGDLGLPTGQGSFTISGSSLNWTAVPEPGGALAGLLLAAGLLRRRRH